MKKIMVVLVAALASVAFAKDMSIEEARANIGECITNMSQLTETMKSLSAEDQKRFLSDINEAISRMPGSNEAKAAAFLNANRAAFKGAKKGNLSTLIAETFATVPVESLTFLNERFAADLFNRSADPSLSYTDEQFSKIAKELTAKIGTRLARVDNGPERQAFAVLMLVRASNGSPAGLQDELVKTLPPPACDSAGDWINDALSGSYDKFLDAAGAGMYPNYREAMVYSGAQLPESMLGFVVEQTPFITTDGEEIGKAFYTAYQENDSTPSVIPIVEPGGYLGQDPGQL